MKRLLFTLFLVGNSQAKALDFSCLERGINPTKRLTSRNGIIIENEGQKTEVVYEIEDSEVIAGPADGDVYRFTGTAIGVAVIGGGSVEFEFLLSADGGVASILTTTAISLYSENESKSFFDCVIPLH